MDSIKYIYEEINNIFNLGDHCKSNGSRDQNFCCQGLDDETERCPEEVSSFSGHLKIKPLMFEDIGGLDAAKKYVHKCVIAPVLHPELLTWGIKPSKAILLHGPPGTGKTMFVKAMVNEMAKSLKEDVYLFYKKGGDLFSKWFGETSNRIRNLFSVAKAYGRSVIFFDEIDGLCPHRGSAGPGAGGYNESTSCFLSEMDDLRGGKVLVIAATNRIDAIDPAIIRPGRFDKDFEFDKPEIEARSQIIKKHCLHWAKDQPKGRLLRNVCEQTAGFTGADLENLCRQTLTCAMDDRCGSTSSLEEFSEKLKILKVLPKHWFLALKIVKKARHGIQKSVVLNLEAPPILCDPLYYNINREIMLKLLPQIELHDKNYRASFVFPHQCCPCVHIWNDKKGFLEFINTIVVPGMLISQTFDAFPKYDLDVKSLLSWQHDATRPEEAVARALTSIRKAKACAVPCVLFALGIDELSQRAPHFIANLIYNEIASLRGTLVVFISTGASPKVSSLDIFRGNSQSKKYQVRDLKRSERYEFFKQMEPTLSKLPFSRSSRHYGFCNSWLNQIVQDCVFISEGDSPLRLMALYDEIVCFCETKPIHYSLTTFKSNVKNILDNYQKSKVG